MAQPPKKNGPYAYDRKCFHLSNSMYHVDHQLADMDTDSTDTASIVPDLVRVLSSKPKTLTENQSWGKT